MKISELKELGLEELTRRLGELKRQMFDFRMQASAGKLDRPHRIGEARREVARVLTFLKERQRSSAEKKG